MGNPLDSSSNSPARVDLQGKEHTQAYNINSDNSENSGQAVTTGRGLGCHTKNLVSVY